MRKQTKVVAVASAAALLAIGASMTSFAATGWVEEDGQWYYYDKDGNRVEDEWKKSGDNWYWLDSEEGGAMAVDKLIEDDDDTYYVDANGVMVKNTWVKVINEDQDDEDDPAEYNYYYMQSNGKAYKAPDSGDTKFRTIDGKRYAFDDDGKMLYGWVDGSSERLSGDTDWATTDEDVYYCGEWEDGAMKTGWQKITVCDDQDDDEEKDFWFWFKSNGKRYVNTTSNPYKDGKKINGKKYGFDDRGVMVYEWAQVASGSGTEASVSNWKYFSDPEDGARKTKGWFKVVAPSEDNDNVFDPNYDGDGFASTDADDETERWYYADSDGELKYGCIEKIKGKYYGFWPEDEKGDQKAGSMLSGLVLLEVKDDQILHVWDDGVDGDELEDIVEDDMIGGNELSPMYGGEITLFYFGDGSDEDVDGSMRTGTTTISVDGDSYQFKFEKTGGAEKKGRGVTGIDDDKYIYKYGLKIKADADDKYKVIYADGDIADDTAVVGIIDSADLRKDTTVAGKNKDGESVKFVGEENNVWNENYKLVNTSGAIVDTKTAAKDGDDWYFYVNDERIVMYVNNKTLKDDVDDGYEMKIDLDSWKDWAEKEDAAFEPDVDFTLNTTINE